jgi:hypothetical protein
VKILGRPELRGLITGIFLGNIAILGTVGQTSSPRTVATVFLGVQWRVVDQEGVVGEVSGEDVRSRKISVRF